jgi:hypothetical protein
MKAEVKKLDLKKALPSYSAAGGRYDIIDIPPLRYLAMDAEGAPENAGFGEAVATVFALAYALKFASKRDLGRDYVVPPLEALWWADDPASFSTARDRSKWRSTALILLPELITDAMVTDARETCAPKVAPSVLARARVETLVEGLCGQTLHLGPFATEGSTIAALHRAIAALHRAIADAGLTLAGKHHEIYLSDMRRTAPEKLRTIVRQPAVR